MASPASEGSILISTISHCSLAAGRIDSSTWLSQTSGSRKHRGHQRREPLLLLRLRPLSFLSGTGAQCNKSETGGRKRRKKIYHSPSSCLWGYFVFEDFPPPSGFFTTLSNSAWLYPIYMHTYTWWASTWCSGDWLQGNRWGRSLSNLAGLACIRTDWSLTQNKNMHKCGLGGSHFWFSLWLL